MYQGCVAVEIPLTVTAAEPVEDLCLSVGLDPFGDRREVERVAKLDDGARQRHAPWVRGDVCDERPVDLEGVDLKLGEERHGGVPRAEVVDREPHAEAADRVERLEESLVPVGERALGDLERERREVAAGARGEVGQISEDGAVADLDGRDVDMDLEVPAPGCCRGRLGEDVAAEAVDQVALLGNPDEVGRGDDSAAWVGPAREGLGPRTWPVASSTIG